MVEPRPGSHGPVRVDGFHFVHADGTRYRPVGTTAYAWTHQPDELQERTLRTLEGSPFTKMRMCIFPKSYLYNANEPDDFPFPGSLEDGFDLERFDTAHFRRLEQRIAQLGDARHRGRPDPLPRVRPLGLRRPRTRRRRAATCATSCAGSPRSRTCGGRWPTSTTCCGRRPSDDWERHRRRSSARRTRTGTSHSIHNCRAVLRPDPAVDHAREHPARRRLPHRREHRRVARAVGQAGRHRRVRLRGRHRPGLGQPHRRGDGAPLLGGRRPRRLRRPRRDVPATTRRRAVVVQGRRAARRRARRGSAFLDEHHRASRPTACSIRCPPTGTCRGAASRTSTASRYFGFNRPRFRNVVLPEGDFEIDVIDTWNMTVERLRGHAHAAPCASTLPGRQFMAVRARRVE